MRLATLLCAWNRIEQYLVGLLGVSALLLALYVMLTRYILPQFSLDWGEEVIVYLLVWATWISSSRLVADQRHIQADLVVKLVSRNLYRKINLLHQFIGLVFSTTMAVAGLEITWFAFQIGERTESSIHFPLWMYYLAIPFGLFLMALRYGHCFLQVAFTKRKVPRCQ